MRRTVARPVKRSGIRTTGDTGIAPSSFVALCLVHGGGTFVILLGAFGFRSAPGVPIVPFQDDFGWSRATVSVAISLNLLLFGFMGPFAAALMARFGIRTVFTASLLVIATGALLTTQLTQPWRLYLLWGVTAGLGTGSLANMLAAPPKSTIRLRKLRRLAPTRLASSSNRLSSMP